MNHLANESSPYLQQHQDNPVDWYPYNSITLQKAKEENLPIFLSIGYSACHWCHVMAHESFEDPKTAEFLNQQFLSIKVDREELPAVDQVYQTIAQIMGQNGGWPLSVFLTPNQKPILIGTYFPNRPKYGMISFMDVLERVLEAFKNNLSEIEHNAEKIEEISVRIYTDNFDESFGSKNTLNESILVEALQQMTLSFDPQMGGFGHAPKFPNFPALQFLIRQYADMHYSMKFQENVSLFSKMKSSQSLLRLIELSLDKMAKGGIYDQLKGGFHRYSVDNQWLVPHFEKMLYDNALALEVYAEGYQAFHNPLYKQRVQEIIRWLLDEMQSPTGGFYGTLDADSEGKEGSYYIWSFQELEELFDPNELDLLQDFYGVSKPGNFEGKNILFQQTSIERLATSYEISAEVLVSQLEGIKEKLLMKRATRVKPGLDDKIITAWNGLTLSGLISAYKMHFLENPADPILQNLSETLYKNLRFFQEKLFNNNTKTLFRIFHHEQAKFAGSLDDYVYLIRALLDYLDIFQILPKVTEQDLQEISRFLSLLMEVTIENFWNPEHSAFYYSDLKRDSGLNLSLNPKQNYDAPLPNPNVMMAQNIFRYLDFTNTLEKQKYDTWLETAEKVLQKQLPIAKKNPTAYASYYLTLQTMLFGDTELTDARFSSEKNSNEPLIHVYYPRTKLLLPKEENIPQLHNKLQICFHHSCLLNEISKI